LPSFKIKYHIKKNQKKEVSAKSDDDAIRTAQTHLGSGFQAEKTVLSAVLQLNDKEIRNEQSEPWRNPKSGEPA
jgi:hypothetical protein